VRLAERCGLPRLADDLIGLPRSKDGTGAFPGAKVMSLVGGMVAGADSIDDMARLRHGAMGGLFTGLRAPSMLGSFLRSFTHGHVKQLHAVARRFLPELARLPRCCLASARSPMWTSTTRSGAPTATPSRAQATDTARSRA
jgi:hypothetical protein